MHPLMVPRNPFETARNFINFRKYEDVISIRINNFVGALKTHFNWLNSQKILNIFWDIVDKKINPDPHNLNVKIVYLAGKFMMFDFLLEEKKISQLDFDIFHQWYKYLCERIIPHVHKIDDNFFGSLISNIPIINVEPMCSLFEKAIKMFNQTRNLKDYLINEEVDPIDKVMKFEQHYMKLYQAFLNRCELFGLEMGKNEGGKNYQDNLRKIFHLNQRNAKGGIIQKGGKFKPPELIDFILDQLVHIRNAIGHENRGGIRIVGDNMVRIIDSNHIGVITYEKEYNFPGLWQVIYILTTFEIGFEMVALFIDIFKHAMFIESKYNVPFICDCNYIDKYFIQPSTKLIICKKCGKLHFTDKLQVAII